MDLRLYLRVIWRFRIVVGLGLLLALVLAFLSFVRVSVASGGPKFSYRQSETWQSGMRFVLTGPGFPVFSVEAAKGSPLNLTALSSFYAKLATSDEVLRLAKRNGPLNGVMEAQTGIEQVGFAKTPTPYLLIIGLAATRSNAISVAARGGHAFQQYVAREQEASGVPARERIQLRVVNVAREAVLLEPRKRTLPIVIFLTVMTAALGLAFVLDNLRPRIHAVSDLKDDERHPESRRSA